MKFEKKWTTALSVCFVMLIIFSTMTVCAQEPMKIGVISPLTGGNGPFGEEYWRGIQIAIDVQNAKGGVQGREIEATIMNAPDPETAISAVEKLINDGNIVIVNAGISSR